MLGLCTLEVLAQIMMKERPILQTDFLTSVLFLPIHETDGNVKILHPRTPLSNLCFKIVYTSFTHHITHCALCGLPVSGNLATVRYSWL